MAPIVEQAWALPVDIATLGAHLTAYITTRRAIDTLRLCNRFGPVGKGITTLPTELVEHVEQHLVEDERDSERKAWADDQKCFEGRCETIDHLGPDALHDTYHAMQSAGEFDYTDEDRLCVIRECHRVGTEFELGHARRHCGFCKALGPSRPHSKAHLANQRSKVENRLEQLNKMRPRDLFLRYSQLWVDVCHDSQNAWQERISSNRGDGLGLLGKVSKVLQKDFGLQIRVIHEPWDAHDCGMMYNASRPTVAYLQLPAGPSVQAPSSLPVPTPVRLDRFGRAVRILGLEVVEGSEEMDEPNEEMDECDEEIDESGEEVDESGEEVDESDEELDESDEEVDESRENIGETDDVADESEDTADSPEEQTIDPEEAHTNQQGQDVSDDVEGISTKQPRLLTFAKFVDYDQGDYVRASDSDINGTDLAGDEWMWGVVKN